MTLHFIFSPAISKCTYPYKARIYFDAIRIFDSVSLIRILFFISFWLCSLSLYSQEEKELSIQPSELEFPHTPKPNMIVVPTPSIFPIDRPCNILKNTSDKRHQVSCFEINLYDVLPTNSYIYSNGFIRNELHKIQVVGDVNQNHFLIYFDGNYNGTLLDDVPDKGLIGKPIYKKLYFYSDTSTWPDAIPLQVMVSKSNGRYKLNVLSLLTYDVEFAIDTNIYKIQLVCSHWEINFKFRPVTKSKKELQEGNFTLDEPFMIDSNWYSFSTLDFKKKDSNFSQA